MMDKSSLPITIGLVLLDLGTSKGTNTTNQRKYEQTGILKEVSQKKLHDMSPKALFHFS